MPKDMKMTLLYDFYREMLTEKQADCVDLYYNEDLSLSEISENIGITRQGVRDSVRRGEKTLRDAEAKLKLVARFDEIRQKTVKIDEIIGEIERSSMYVPEDVRGKINEILSVVKEIQQM